MASVSQTINNFKLGVSKQPDTQLIPGQLKEIINATPDLTEGLPKRNGTKRIGSNPLTNVQCNGTFFSYFRDETEGSYIGQVDPLGKVRMWSCKDGAEKNVWYNTDDTAYSSTNGLHTAISSYLTPSSITATEDIQALTINDTTYLTNRTKTVATQFESTYVRGVQQIFATSAVNTTDNYLVINNHLLETGDSVKYHHGGGTALAPLVNNTTYYAIKISDNWFRLASTKANAEANEMLDLTGTGNNAQYLEKNFVTVTEIGHNLNTGESVNIDFTSGGATDGDYKVTSTTSSTFTITDPAAYSAITGDNDCICKPITDMYEHKYYAFIDLLRTENGRQYGLNITNDDSSFADTSIKTATRLKISRSNAAGSNSITGGQDSSGGTGHCPGIGTQVFAVTAKDSYTGTTTVSVKNDAGNVTYGTASNKKNLIFRITSLGQQGSSPGGNFDDANLSDQEYMCSYNNRVELLHGGEGWAEGDKIIVTLDQAAEPYNFEIRIEKIQTAVVKASIKAVRPEPTSFDADTAVTTDAVLGGIITEISGLTIGTDPLGYDIIGSGIYLWSDSEFNIQVPSKDLIRVMQSEINDVSNLPNQCKHGYIVKVTNSSEADDDDYYLKFVGENGKNGPGSWTECAQPGLVKGFIPSTMPHILERLGDGDFLLKANTWTTREVGDDVTNPLPTFADGSSKINKILFFRNRLAILSGENVILSRPGELAVPSFFAKTALAVSAIDPIDISSSSTYPSDLFDGIEIPAGLVVFSTNQQFLLSADAEILNPDTAKFRSISHYSYDKNISPISLGTTIGYVDNTGGSCRFMEMQQIQREQEPVVVETSKVVQDWLPNDVNHIINSPENGLVFFQSLNAGFESTYIYGFKYQNYGERKQAAWFKWLLDTGHEYSGGIRYTFIINDSLFVLNSDNFLMQVYLSKGSSTNDPRYFVNNNRLVDWNNFPIYLDNWTTITGGVYDSDTNKTTFTHGVNGCVFNWHNHISQATDSTSSEELFLQYSEDSDPTSGSATWVTAGKIIPVNTAKPAGVNNYSVELSCPIQSKGEIAFRLYQPTNTSYTFGGGSVASMDTYGIMTLKYLKSDSTTHSTLTMSDTNNHLAKSHAVGVKATASGSGSQSGFNTGADYLWFSAHVDNNIGDGRYVILPKINVSNNSISKIEIAAHVGNDTNGGEWPDIPNSVTNDDLYALGFKNLPSALNRTYPLVQKVEDLIKGYQFKVSGDWSSATIYLGFHYGVYIEFPRFYFTQSSGETIKRDTNDYLVLHRLKVNLKESSSVSVTVMSDLEKTTNLSFSPRVTNEQNTDRLPYSTIESYTIPIYKKNDTVTVTLNQTDVGDSNDVGPFNLESITWEGDYNPKNYRRV